MAALIKSKQQRPAMAARAAAALLPLASRRCALWVIMAMVASCFQSAAAYTETQRHQNFGKFHSSPHPPSYAPHPRLTSKPSSSAAHIALAVEGVVVCQSCRHANTNSLLNSTPLQGAKVTLACRDMRFKTFVLETAITNERGYFLFRVEDFEFQRHKGVRGCRVVLVSSPDPSCASITNVNAGRVGSPLITRQKVFKGEILYSVGPFAFSPSSSSCYKH